MSVPRLKMKDLERATGVGRETIRFYIARGLVPAPERPHRNVAFYDDSHVERIRLIKELQRKRFLPLQVIKAIVDGDARPPDAEIATLRALDGRLYRGRVQPGERVSVAEVCRRTGVSAADVRGLADAGAITIGRDRKGIRSVDDTGAHIIELWGRLRHGGYTAALGFAPEQLRLYVDLVRVLAREELRRFTHGVTGQIAAERAAAMAEVGIDVMNDLIGALRKAVLLEYVAAGNVPAAPSERPASRPSRRRAS